MSYPGHLLCLLEYLFLANPEGPCTGKSVLGPPDAMAVCVSCGPITALGLSLSASLCGACPAGSDPRGEMGCRRGMMTVHYRGLSTVVLRGGACATRPAYWDIHLLIHLLIRSVIYSFIHLLTQSLGHSVTSLIVHSFLHSLADVARSHPHPVESGQYKGLFPVWVLTGSKEK